MNLSDYTDLDTGLSGLYGKKKGGFKKFIKKHVNLKTLVKVAPMVMSVVPVAGQAALAAKVATTAAKAAKVAKIARAAAKIKKTVATVKKAAALAKKAKQLSNLSKTIRSADKVVKLVKNGKTQIKAFKKATPEQVVEQREIKEQNEAIQPSVTEEATNDPGVSNSQEQTQEVSTQEQTQQASSQEQKQETQVQETNQVEQELTGTPTKEQLDSIASFKNNTPENIKEEFEKKTATPAKNNNALLIIGGIALGGIALASMSKSKN